MTYVDVAGLATWHEVSGSGEPVVLLHGAFGGAASWSAQVPALVAAGFEVSVPERRGHAHTRDVEGPLTYGVMPDQLLGDRDAAIGYLRGGYDPFSPDGPDHFLIVFDKTVAMVESEPELDLASFTSVTAPTLVLQGDRDAVTLAHGVAVAAAVADGRLAVLPGTHALPIESPTIVNPLLVSFLRGGPTPLF